jgi:hypothetical protein
VPSYEDARNDRHHALAALFHDVILALSPFVRLARVVDCEIWGILYYRNARKVFK